MKLKKLLADDEQAVSPVIGVILMVAITVILAAVIATFVLGMGESVSDTAPQASFDFQPQNDQIVMESGDKLDGANIKIGGDVSSNPSGSITAGSKISVSFTSSQTVKVIWTNPNGQDSATIGSYNA